MFSFYAEMPATAESKANYEYFLNLISGGDETTLSFGTLTVW